MNDTITTAPTSTPTRLIYRSPSGRTEVAVRDGHLAVSVIGVGADWLSHDESKRLADAINAAIQPSEEQQ